MHQALQTPEIARLILRQLLPPVLEVPAPPEAVWASPSSRGYKKNLLNAALTCRSFSGDALQFLWWYMNTLTPLFSLLPNFSSLQDNSPVKAIQGPVAAADIATFDKYARRVRYYHRMSTDNIHVSSFTVVLHACNRLHLFPNLRYFHTEVYSLELMFFVSPHLDDFTATAEAYAPMRTISHPDLRSTVSTLPTATPDLRFLSLRSNLNASCLSAILMLRRLEKLHIEDRFDLSTAISYPFFRGLADLRSLSRLHLAHGTYFDVGESIFPGIMVFHTLEEFHLSTKGTDIEKLNIILRSASFPRLDSLFVLVQPSALETFKFSDRSNWQNFFSLLRNATTGSFTHLAFRSSTNINEHESFWTRLGFAFSTMHVLEEFDLTSFELSVPIFPSLNMDDMTKMTTMWPRLKALRIETSNPPYLDFRLLVHLAQHLPSLRILFTTLDVRQLPSFSDIPLLNHDLEDITLNNSRLEEPILFASALDRMYPKLRKRTFDSFAEEGWEDNQRLALAWDDVDILLNSFQDARRDERSRVQNALPR